MAGCTPPQVAGNFHIAFGDSVVKDGRHIHQFIPSEAPGTTHHPPYTHRRV